MLSKKTITQLITGAFLAISTIGFAAPQAQVVEPTKPREVEGQGQTGILHYEGDMEDNLANPLDSTNEELDEEAEELEVTEKKMNERS